MESHFGSSTEHFSRPLDSVRVTDFFGHVTEVRQLAGSYPFTGATAGGGGGGGQQQAAAGAGGGGGGQQQAAAGSCTAGGGGTCGFEQGSGGSGSGSSGGGGGLGLAAARVKGRLRGGGGGDGGGGSKWGVPFDGLALSGVVGLLLAVVASSLAWGRSST